MGWYERYFSNEAEELQAEEDKASAELDLRVSLFQSRGWKWIRGMLNERIRATRPQPANDANLNYMVGYHNALLELNDEWTALENSTREALNEQRDEAV